MKKILALIFALTMLGCSSDDGGTQPPEKPTEKVTIVANDDTFTTTENTKTSLSGLMDNDEIEGYVRIKEFEAETQKGGAVVDNRDGTFTYEPPADYIGTDSFKYTICDNAETPNCDSASVIIEITGADPLAVDDTYSTTEETPLIIVSYTENDEMVDNAVVTSVDSENSSGSVVLESDGNIIYTPAKGFVGEDSFTYTICDDDETPSCSTATVTVTVIDEGSPTAEDDSLAVEAGTVLEIQVSDLLSNDDLQDDAEFTSFDDSSTQGSVVLNQDGTLTFTHASGFRGEDTFTYTICDDDETPSCDTATVSISVVETLSFNIPNELQSYYADLTISTDAELNEQEVASITSGKHTVILSYGQRHDYLYDADEDLANPDNVILMYTGESRYWEEYDSPNNPYSPQTFNTEHIYPQSRLVSADAVTDLHHLRVADEDINRQRNNYPYVEGSGSAGEFSSGTWYPGDEWKGDVARMIMYLHVRYGESFEKVGTLELFLKWNAEDPVSEFELQRQQVIESAQGNRNPFIDNPYLATLIWGGPAAENRWE